MHTLSPLALLNALYWLVMLGLEPQSNGIATQNGHIAPEVQSPNEDSCSTDVNVSFTINYNRSRTVSCGLSTPRG